jgi:hypothetical protein
VTAGARRSRRSRPRTTDDRQEEGWGSILISANMGPCIRKALSVICCPVRVSAKGCGKAAKCIERAVDMDQGPHELLRRPVQTAGIS